MNIDEKTITEKDIIIMSRVALNRYEVEEGRRLNVGKRKAFLDGFERCLREHFEVKEG